jgi:hypothetical protein
MPESVNWYICQHVDTKSNKIDYALAFQSLSFASSDDLLTDTKAKIESRVNREFEPIPEHIVAQDVKKRVQEARESPLVNLYFLDSQNLRIRTQDKRWEIRSPGKMLVATGRDIDDSKLLLLNDARHSYSARVRVFENFPRFEHIDTNALIRTTHWDLHELSAVRLNPSAPPWWTYGDTTADAYRQVKQSSSWFKDVINLMRESLSKLHTKLK